MRDIIKTITEWGKIGILKKEDFPVRPLDIPQ